MKTIFAVALSAAVACATGTAFAAPSAADTDFVKKAAQAGTAEVAAGNMAVSKGQSESVKTFGQRMVTDHSKAGEELKAVATKSGLTLPSTVSSEQKAAAEKLGKMQGADFDKAYAKQMVSDHQEAVALFQKEASSGNDADLKAFAQKTLPALQEHLKMAQTLP
jgi:putative membrane protein